MKDEDLETLDITIKKPEEEITPVVEENQTPEITTNPPVDTNEPLPPLPVDLGSNKNKILTNLYENRIKYIIIASIVLIVGGLLAFYILVINSNKNIIDKAITQLINQIEVKTGYLEPIDNIDINNSINKISGGLKFQTNIDDYKIYAKYNIDYEFAIDPKNNKIYTNDTIYYDNSSLISFMAFLSDNGLFVELKDIYENMLNIPMGSENTKVDTSSVNNYSNAKLSELLTIIKDSFLDNIDTEYLTKNSIKKTINGENLSVKEYAYKINKTDLQKHISSVLKDLKKNNKALNLIVDITGIKKEDVILWLETNDLNDISEDNISLLIYTTGLGNRFVGMSFKDAEYKNVFSLFVNNNKITFFYESDNARYEINKYNKNGNTFIEYKKNDKALLTIEASSLSKNKIDAKIYNEDKTIDVTVNYEYKKENSKKNIKLRLQVNNDKQYYRFILDNTFEKLNDLNINTSGSKNISELSVEDFNKIFASLEQKFANTPLIDYITQIKESITIEKPPVEEEQVPIVPEYKPSEIDEVDVDLSIVTLNSFKQEVKDMLKAAEDTYINNMSNGKNISCYYKLEKVDELTNQLKIEYSKYDNEINIPKMSNKKGYSYSIKVTYNEVVGSSKFDYLIANGKYFAMGSNMSIYDDISVSETSLKVTTSTCK